ncbi:hypothetical protein J437_LFUL011805, partial [Ladona fulva]
MPTESKKFTLVDRSLRRVMKNAFENPNLLKTCSDRRLLEILKDCSNLLEVVQKGLSDYLETKRLSFPRFYFLSDDELLDILSQAQHPATVQPHLRKCFENIYKLDGLRNLIKGPLQKVERQVLSALITIEVHSRDVVSDLLEK